MLWINDINSRIAYESETSSEVMCSLIKSNNMETIKPSISEKQYMAQKVEFLCNVTIQNYWRGNIAAPEKTIVLCFIHKTCWDTSN